MLKANDDYINRGILMKMVNRCLFCWKLINNYLLKSIIINNYLLNIHDYSPIITEAEVNNCISIKP